MIEKPWLKSYPQGVPEQIDLDEYTSIVALFEESVKKYRDKVAFVSMGAEITYGQLDELAVPDCCFWHPACRTCSSKHQSVVHRKRTATSTDGRRCQRHCDRRKFCTYAGGHSFRGTTRTNHNYADRRYARLSQVAAC